MKLNMKAIVIGGIATLIGYFAEEGTKKALYLASDKFCGDTDDVADEETEETEE